MVKRLHEMLEQRLSFDQASTPAALLTAAARGWIEIDPMAARGEASPHSLSLTEAGRRRLEASLS